MSEGNYVTREEYNQERISISKRLSEHDRKIAELQTICNNLKDVPERMSNLETNIAVMGEKVGNIAEMICRLDKDFQNYIIKKEKNDEAQDDKINKIDEKSKVDIIDWFKENWINIAVATSVGLLIAENFVK